MAQGAPTMNATVVTGSSEPTKLVEFNPAFAAVIVAMVISFFVVGFATGMLKKCMPPAEDDDEDQQSAALKLRPGLDPAIVASLPFVQYKDLSPQLRDSLDCSVCLAAFDPNDTLRLLPKCAHVFHSHCIDAWFRSHNTCPLCRACLAEQHSVVVEICEQGTPLAGPQERSDGASSVSTAEERVNSHPFLQSKVESTFKPALRVGVAHEKAAAFRSIRRSNSTGTDFQFLRPSYVVDSEGTQHNRNYQTHAINVDELLSKGGVWFPSPDPEAGPSNPSSQQRRWWTRWLRKA